MKTWKLKNRLKESESDGILAYLKNSETGEEATVNLLDYTKGRDLIEGCLASFDLDFVTTTDEDLSKIYLTHLSDEVFENFINRILNNISRRTLTQRSLLSLCFSPHDIDLLYGRFFRYSENNNLIKWYDTLKKNRT